VHFVGLYCTKCYHVKFVEYTEFRTVATPEPDDSQIILNTQRTGTNYLYHISKIANGS